MTSNLLAMASNLLAMVSNLRASWQPFRLLTILSSYASTTKRSLLRPKSGIASQRSAKEMTGGGVETRVSSVETWRSSLLGWRPLFLASHAFFLGGSFSVSRCSRSLSRVAHRNFIFHSSQLGMRSILTNWPRFRRRAGGQSLGEAEAVPRSKSMTN